MARDSYLTVQAANIASNHMLIVDEALPECIDLFAIPSKGELPPLRLLSCTYLHENGKYIQDTFTRKLRWLGQMKDEDGVLFFWTFRGACEGTHDTDYTLTVRRNANAKCSTDILNPQGY